mgnify:CR=1 FL=1
MPIARGKPPAESLRPPGDTTLPPWISGAIDTAIDVFGRDPFGGLSPMPLTVNVPRFGQAPATVKALETVLTWLDSKIPGWRKLSDPYDVSIVGRTLRDRYSDIDNPERLGRTKLQMRIHEPIASPEMVGPLILHELAHLPMQKVPGDYLQSIANFASRKLPMNEGLRIGMHYPQKLPGGAPSRDFLEELATTLMEMNMSQRRLGAVRPGGLPTSSTWRDPLKPLSAEERLWK